jgi:hypothetical protein
MDGIGFGFTETSDFIISVKRALPTRANVLRTYPQEGRYFLPVLSSSIGMSILQRQQ